MATIPNHYVSNISEEGILLQGNNLWMPSGREGTVPKYENMATAMGIDLAQNTRPLFKRPLTIEDRDLSPGQIAWGPRIGISKGTERHWRAWIAKHPSVSGFRF